MRAFSREVKVSGKTVGFVPTMGSLHEGHLSLVEKACQMTDVVVMSIFVNPTQFGEGENFGSYPRDLERDSSLAEEKGVDVIFVPGEEEIYPDKYYTFVEVTGSLTEVLCGRSRPGHFRGVTTVIAKLFNIVEPDKSFFGQKDAQQVAVIKCMVKDLDMPVEIVSCPIVREPDGIAMSSRNVYLSPEERKQALRLSRAIEKAKELVLAGENASEEIRSQMTKILESGPDVKIDYIEIVDAADLTPVGKIKNNTLVSIAAYVGGTRLIDNVII